MRRIAWLNIVLVAMCLALAACGKGDTVDTSKLEKSFSTAQPANKSAVDELKAATATKDYAKAFAALQKLALAASLTSDQKQAIEDVAAQLQQRMDQEAKEAAKEGDKALGDIQKRLSK